MYGGGEAFGVTGTKVEVGTGGNVMGDRTVGGNGRDGGRDREKRGRGGLGGGK